ncbi:MAG: ABC transporter ATP-binding protein/permease [Deltaproteobacteria bacterium]|nr:ABC transporter ATP-binding protein/permease [Deltaproteobacteria bacterium]
MTTPNADAIIEESSFFRDLWRLGVIYWRSPAAKVGAALLALAIALELATVYGTVLVARTQAAVFDVIQERNVAAFLGALGWQAAAMLAAVCAATFRIYVRQILEVRWRRKMTAEYLRRWMTPEAYWQLELHGAAMDNPDQRIAEDIRIYVASALGLSLSLLSSLVALASFGGMLWGLSRGWPLALPTGDVYVPGFLMWVAVGYAAFAMWLTHVVGRKLVPLNFDKLRYEADFRYGLVRFRDQVEPVAFSHGEVIERRHLLQRFGNIVENWWQLIRAQRDLSLTTLGLGQMNGVVPMLLAAPAYFGGHLTLGKITQVGFAYGQVSGALTWFVSAYQEIALWRASIQRLASFADVMTTTARELAQAKRFEVERRDGGVLRLHDVVLHKPDGRPLVRAVGSIRQGESIALLGPTGSGKTTLFRALAGLWPFGSGRIEIPRAARMHFVPPRPYLPVGSLRFTLTYPDPEVHHSDEVLREALRVLDLGFLASALDEQAQWHARLSVAEQQRLSLVRVLVKAPDWVFLDEATSALDEAMEAKAYGILRAHLPRATLLSIAHRPSVAALHDRRWALVLDDDGVGLVVVDAGE